MKTLISSLVAVAILVGSPPVARADSSTDYLAILDQNKISYGNPTTAINIGNSICQQLQSNVDPGKAVEAALNAGYGGEQAGKILFAASHQLCPDTAAAVDKCSNTPQSRGGQPD